jgi:hypothetical protein
LPSGAARFRLSTSLIWRIGFHLSAAPFEAFDTTFRQATSQVLVVILDVALLAEVLVAIHEEPHDPTIS